MKLYYLDWDGRFKPVQVKSREYVTPAEGPYTERLEIYVPSPPWEEVEQ